MNNVDNQIYFIDEIIKQIDVNKLRGVQIENICGAEKKLSNKILQINSFEEEKIHFLNNDR